MALHNLSTVPQTHWEIDPKLTRIEFAIGKSSLHRVKGRFHGVRGWVVTSGDEAGDAMTQVEIDAASIDTGLKLRDWHLRTGQFLAVKRFPMISFASTGVEDRGQDRFRITGELILRGITQPIALDATVEQRDAARAQITASTVLDRRDFTIGPKAMGLVVGDDVAVRIELVLDRTDRPGAGSCSSAD